MIMRVWDNYPLSFVSFSNSDVNMIIIDLYSALSIIFITYIRTGPQRSKKAWFWLTQTDETSGLLIPNPEHIQTSCDVPPLATPFPSASELKIDKLYFRMGWERKIVIILLTKILPAKEEINSILIRRLLNWQVLDRKSYHYRLNYGNVQTCFMGVPGGSALKNPPAMQEPQV